MDMFLQQHAISSQLPGYKMYSLSIKSISILRLNYLLAKRRRFDQFASLESAKSISAIVILSSCNILKV